MQIPKIIMYEIIIIVPFFPFLFGGESPPSSQINTTDTYSYLRKPGLAWLLSRKLFINYLVNLLPLGFYRFLVYLPFFISYSTACSVADPWNHPLLLLLPDFSPDFLSYLLFLPASLAYSLSCLAIGYSTPY